MKKIIILCIVLCFLLPTAMLSASASKYINTEFGLAIWSDEPTNEVLLDMEKVFQKEYPQETLHDFVQYNLSSTRLVGELLVYAKTDNADATATTILNTVGKSATCNCMTNAKLTVYIVKMDDGELKNAMLALLAQGFYATANTVELNAAESANMTEYTLGDINQNSTINAQDYMKLKRIVLRTYTANENELLLADVNRDGKINAQDYMMVKCHVLGTYEITDGIWFLS